MHPDFDASWPFAGDHLHRLWDARGGVDFVRLEPGDRRPIGEITPDAGVTRLVALGVPATARCVERLPSLREAAFAVELPSDAAERLRERGVSLYRHDTEGFWGQSVAEYGLALTLCGLRRIPQLHHAILTGHDPWDYRPPAGIGRPGARGGQFGDDRRFTCGTVDGKRVRIVGVGNIGSRHASFVRILGADVAAWDPYASEPCFHRSGARREWRLDRLVRDAEIFAPMLPLKAETRGIVTADHIRSLPKGCLVVLVTRAGICDMPAPHPPLIAAT